MDCNSSSWIHFSTGLTLNYGFFTLGSFRFFDIVKLGLVGWPDKLGGALGVILDDILALQCDYINR